MELHSQKVVSEICMDQYICDVKFRYHVRNVVKEYFGI